MSLILQRKTLTIGLVLFLFWLGHALYQLHQQRVLAKLQVQNMETKVSEIQRNNEILASSSAISKVNAYLNDKPGLS